jgi:hypothetical protein
MNVSSLMADAFALAAQSRPDLSRAWIQVSVRLGGALPNSRLMVAIQRDGNLDLVLRCMEDERANPGHAGEQAGLFQDHYQLMLSELWVGSLYESLRLLMVERKLISDSDEIRALAEDFRLLRVPLEKHEITSEGQLTAPLQLLKYPPRHDQTNLYEYSKADPKRSHIMPSGISGRGSVMWRALDLKNDREQWIERRALSDRVIALWGQPVAAPTVETAPA